MKVRNKVKAKMANTFKKIIKKHKNLKDDILKLDYNNIQYRIEADECQPNDTMSRREIYKKNDIL